MTAKANRTQMGATEKKKETHQNVRIQIRGWARCLLEDTTRIVRLTLTQHMQDKLQENQE